jgi:hypothetical protein
MADELTNPPAIILRRNNRFEIISDSGRMVAWSQRFVLAQLWLFNHGYDEVPLNSRCGRTILDKIERKTT